MAKIVRVSSLSRGKKLILGDPDYEIFSTIVKEKFSLDPIIQIHFEDEHGAEVGQDIFPILLEQNVIPNLILKIVGEEPQIVYVDSPLALFPSTPATLSPSSTQPKNEDVEIESYKEIIESHIQQNNVLQQLVNESNEKLCVSADASSILIKELVAKFVDLKGISPSSKDQKIFARAVLLVIPSWRYPGSEDGTDILFDQVGRGGLIQARLRHIHKSLNKDKPKIKKPLELAQGGPSPKRPNVELNLEVDSTPQGVIDELNGLCSKASELTIKKLMIETLPHRTILRKRNPLSILNTYKKFLDCDFLINYEFSLMHENSADKFTQIWTSAAPKILQKGKDISKSPAFKKFILEEADKWDVNVAALFTLLYLIPPAPQGQGKGSRSKIGKKFLK